MIQTNEIFTEDIEYANKGLSLDCVTIKYKLIMTAGAYKAVTTAIVQEVYFTHSEFGRNKVNQYNIETSLKEMTPDEMFFNSVRIDVDNKTLVFS